MQVSGCLFPLVRHASQPLPLLAHQLLVQQASRPLLERQVLCSEAEEMGLMVDHLELQTPRLLVHRAPPSVLQATKLLVLQALLVLVHLVVHNL